MTDNSENDRICYKIVNFTKRKGTGCMKKWISFLCVVLLTGALAGCGGSKEQTAAFTMEQDGMVNKITLEATNDEVHTFTQVSEVDLSAYDEEVVDQVESAATELESSLTAYESVQYSYEVNDGMLKETIIIDMSNTDELKELVDQGFIPINGGGDDMKISLEQSTKSLQDAGWTMEGGDAQSDVSK